MGRAVVRGATAILAVGLVVFMLSGCGVAGDRTSATSSPASGGGRPTPSAPAGAVGVTTPSTSPDAPAGFHPEVGMCFDVRKDQPKLSESIVPCGERHDDEVYAVFDLDVGEYPGETALQLAADEGCRARFADFIGISFDESILEISSLWPSQSAWLDGDRRISCVVWYPEDAVVGSLAGAAY